VVLHCPNCGKEIKDEDALYCPYCSRRIEEASLKRTGFPVAGGILAIIGSCLSNFLGVGGIAISWHANFYVGIDYPFLFLGLVGVLAFLFGAIGGIMALRRKDFALSVIGACFLLFHSIVTILSFGSVHLWEGGLVYGTPLLVLSILSLVFIAISKKEFS
jgi:ABC-type branched-subunit amino acid transport system permease subunit